MEKTKVARFLYILSIASLLLPQSIDSTTTNRNVKSVKDPTLSREERERDFLDWVGRVGARVRANITKTIAFKGTEISGNVITVDKSGNADFTSVQEAVNSVPSYTSQRVIIQIGAGLYEEKVSVPSEKPYLTFEGAGSGLTTISWDGTASSSGSTENSASVTISSDNFIARGITFKNSAAPPSGGASGRQAVAVRITGDKAAFYSCNFLGAQDTLYDEQGRHYFQNCFIQGSIDFICGDGQSLYKGCQLNALPVPGGSQGSFTAQERSSPGDNAGYSFVDCELTGSGRLYLGRAWGPYSRVVFSYTSMDNIIIPSGWFNWGDASRDNKVFYGQYKCTGPGASENGRVGWSHELTDAQAAPFQSLGFIDGASWVQA